MNKKYNQVNKKSIIKSLSRSVYYSREILHNFVPLTGLTLASPITTYTNYVSLSQMMAIIPAVFWSIVVTLGFELTSAMKKRTFIINFMNAGFFVASMFLAVMTMQIRQTDGTIERFSSDPLLSEWKAERDKLQNQLDAQLEIHSKESEVVKVQSEVGALKGARLGRKRIEFSQDSQRWLISQIDDYNTKIKNREKYLNESGVKLKESALEVLSFLPPGLVGMIINILLSFLCDSTIYVCIYYLRENNPDVFDTLNGENGNGRNKSGFMPFLKFANILSFLKSIVSRGVKKDYSHLRELNSLECANGYTNFAHKNYSSREVKEKIIYYKALKPACTDEEMAVWIAQDLNRNFPFDRSTITRHRQNILEEGRKKSIFYSWG